jgi:hypothetical protein
VLCVCGSARRGGCAATREPRQCGDAGCPSEAEEDPGTRPAFRPSISAAPISPSRSGAFSARQPTRRRCPWRPATGRRGPDHLALPLPGLAGPVFGWTLLAAAVLAVWPTHGALFPVAGDRPVPGPPPETGRRRWPRGGAGGNLVVPWWPTAPLTGRSRCRTRPGSLRGAHRGPVRRRGGPHLARTARPRRYRMERERDQNNALAAAVEQRGSPAGLHTRAWPTPRSSWPCRWCLAAVARAPAGQPGIATVADRLRALAETRPVRRLRRAPASCGGAAGLA